MCCYILQSLLNVITRSSHCKHISFFSFWYCIFISHIRNFIFLPIYLSINIDVMKWKTKQRYLLYTIFILIFCEYNEKFWDAHSIYLPSHIFKIFKFIIPMFLYNAYIHFHLTLVKYASNSFISTSEEYKYTWFICMFSIWK